MSTQPSDIYNDIREQIFDIPRNTANSSCTAIGVSEHFVMTCQQTFDDAFQSDRIRAILDESMKVRAMVVSTGLISQFTTFEPEFIQVIAKVVDGVAVLTYVCDKFTSTVHTHRVFEIRRASVEESRPTYNDDGCVLIRTDLTEEYTTLNCDGVPIHGYGTSNMRRIVRVSL